MRLKDESAKVVACAIVPRSEDEEPAEIQAEGEAAEQTENAETTVSEDKTEE